MGKVIALVLVVVVGAVVAMQVMKEGPGVAASGPDEGVPPADARFLDRELGARQVIHTIIGLKKADQAAAAADVQGQWVPEPGWSEGVEEVTHERGKTVLRMYASDNTIIGGGFWVLAVVAGDCDVQKGELVDVQGMVSKIEDATHGGIITYRIVLEPARVLRVQNRR